MIVLPAEEDSYGKVILVVVVVLVGSDRGR